MTEKLKWEYNYRGDEQCAMYKGYRIRAVLDTSPDNPFEDQDGHFPMTVRYDGRLKHYDNCAGPAPLNPIARLNDLHMVFDQKAIMKILNVTCDEIHTHSDNWQDDTPKWFTDTYALRQAFDVAFDNLNAGESMTAAHELYKLMGIPSLLTTSTGYSQGDWAELLIVATPQAQMSWGTDITMDNADEMLRPQADLYGYWAWGDIYGYVIMERIDDPKDINAAEEWEEIEYGSCWGFYGPDHDKSGLEESATNAIDTHLRCLGKEKDDGHEDPCPVNRRPKSTCHEGCSHGEG